ncbi:MAG TPA: signal peptidase I [Solirubrobacteraceae bacterium]|nr:signal peptidase I [Solirubrobacteraceae bacterium]HLM86358.1 signal peptidase I [Solirubrobacteraceae bacterium]
MKASAKTRRQSSDGDLAAGAEVTAKLGRRRSKSTFGALIELAVIIAVALGLALGIQAFIVKPYRIPSGSMEPTLEIGQRVLVNRIGMDFGDPHVGEIAVFHPPEGAEQEECGPTAHVVKLGVAACSAPLPKEEASVNFIKRIIAGPGDEIYIKEGHVFRKAAGTSRFLAEKDSYIRACGASPECNFPDPIKIPAGHWFMMGDNRGESDDSRFWGPVPTGWIIGQAVATYWPPDRIGIF